MMRARLRVSVAAAATAIMVSACARATPAEYAQRGTQYATQGKHLEAIVEYRNAVEAEPTLGDAHYRLGLSYEAIGDFGRASREYIRASDLLPADAKVQVKGASMHLLSRNFEAARACADRALKADPKNAVAQVLLAHSLAGLKQSGAALSNIQKAIALDPTRGDTYADLAVFQMAKGSPEQAEANLKRAVEIDPGSARSQLTLASFLWAQGRFNEAEAQLKRAVDAQPDGDVTASRALATFYLGLNRTAEAEVHLRSIADKIGSVSARLALADYYITLDQFDKAVPLLELVSGVTEGYGDARSRLAAIAYGQKRTAEAHRILAETLEKAPRSARAMMTRATFLLAEHKVDEALTQLREAVTADPRSLSAHYALALLLASRQDTDAATQEFNQMLTIDPDSIVAKMELAKLHLATGKADLAARLAQEAATSRPNIETALLLARALAAKGEFSRAEVVLRPLLSGDTSRPDILSLAAGVYVNIGESDLGRQLLERAAKANPDAPEPIEGLVAMELAEGNISAARTAVQQRLARRPGDSRLLVLAARTYGASRDATRMIEALKKALEANPNNVTAYAMLGQAYASEGRLEEALAEFQQLAALDPKSVAASTMVAFLLEAKGQLPEAERQYQRVLDLALAGCGATLERLAITLRQRHSRRPRRQCPSRAARGPPAVPLARLFPAGAVDVGSQGYPEPQPVVRGGGLPRHPIAAESAAVSIRPEVRTVPAVHGPDGRVGVRLTREHVRTGQMD